MSSTCSWLPTKWRIDNAVGAQLLQMCFQGVNLMLPRKRALYADLLLYSPKVVSFHLCWSGISGCKTKPSTRSQMYKYSLSTCTDKAPLISATQRLLSKAWATVRRFTARLGISLHKFGASSDKVLPCNHLSNQNLVDSPLPTMVSTATLKRALTYCGTWIGKLVQEYKRWTFIWQKNNMIIQCSIISHPNRSEDHIDMVIVKLF